MGSRRKGRVIAFQALFSWDACKPKLDDLLQFSWLEPERREKLGEDILAFAKMIVAGTLENIQDIDQKITRHAKNWDIKRISKVDLAILRTSIYSLTYNADIPASVTIDEAIEIAKQFGSDESYKFINGILDSVRKGQNPL
jgi:N utilization substance protein B